MSTIDLDAITLPTTREVDIPTAWGIEFEASCMVRVRFESVEEWRDFLVNTQCRTLNFDVEDLDGNVLGGIFWEESEDCLTLPYVRTICDEPDTPSGLRGCNIGGSEHWIECTDDGMAVLFPASSIVIDHRTLWSETSRWSAALVAMDRTAMRTMLDAAERADTTVTVEVPLILTQLD